jgi:hypothetical protein
MRPRAHGSPTSGAPRPRVAPGEAGTAGGWLRAGAWHRMAGRGRACGARRSARRRPLGAAAASRRGGGLSARRGALGAAPASGRPRRRLACVPAGTWSRLGGEEEGSSPAAAPTGRIARTFWDNSRKPRGIAGSSRTASDSHWIAGQTRGGSPSRARAQPPQAPVRPLPHCPIATTNPAAKPQPGGADPALSPTRSRRTPPDRAAAASRPRRARRAGDTDRRSTTDDRRRRSPPSVMVG